MQTNRLRRRRAFSAIYMMVAMAVLCGLCSFGVDLGRVQVVKGQLQNGADAAARAAASALPGDLGQARARALQYAAYHKADGAPIGLVPADDIEFGVWNETTRQFQPFSGSALSAANAVRVTARRTAARGNATPLAFASILGVKSCDASASAVACITAPPPTMGVVGIDFVSHKGGDRIDSYNSGAGTYSSSNSGSDVHVASNGKISIGGSSIINGHAHVTSLSNATGNITGSINVMDEPLSYAPAKLNGTYTSHGDISLKSGQTLTLTKGRHYATSLSLSGNAVLNVSGPVKLYVQGAINIDGNTEIATAGNTPAHLEIYVLGSAPIKLGKNNLYASIYAPNSHLTMSGNSNLFGAVVARSISMSGNNTIHYDTALTPPPVDGLKIVLVK